MFRASKNLTEIEIVVFKEIREGLFIEKLLLLVFLLAASVFMILALSGIYALIAMIGLGLMYAHAIELQHQCLHNTAFRSKQWNRLVGILLGIPMLVSYSDYQTIHLEHHKLLGTQEDKEFFDYDYNSFRSIKGLITHFLMLRHYRNLAVRIYQSFITDPKSDSLGSTAKKIRSEYRIMTCFLVFMLVITVSCQTMICLKLWLIPFMVAVPTHALIELPEHIVCEKTTDVFKNTRTIETNKLLTWFVNGNNYHVEHHAFPNIPNDKLSDLHKKIQPNIEVLHPSYRSFFIWLWLFLYHNYN